MRNGLRIQVVAASPVSEVDLDATREARELIHEQVRLRHHLRRMLDTPDFDQVVVATESTDVVTA